MGSQADVLKSLGEYKIIEYKSEGRLLVETRGNNYIADLEGCVFKEIAAEDIPERSLLAKESGKRFIITRNGRIFKEITIEGLMASLKES